MRFLSLHWPAALCPTLASARQQIGLGSTDSPEFAALTIGGGAPWTTANSVGSVSSDATYAIQRFPSGEVTVRGTSVVTLDGNARAVIPVGLTVVTGSWFGLACNGDFAVNGAGAIVDHARKVSQRLVWAWCTHHFEAGTPLSGIFHAMRKADLHDAPVAPGTFTWHT